MIGGRPGRRLRCSSVRHSSGARLQVRTTMLVRSVMSRHPVAFEGPEALWPPCILVAALAETAQLTRIGCQRGSLGVELYAFAGPHAGERGGIPGRGDHA